MASEEMTSDFFPQINVLVAMATNQIHCLDKTHKLDRRLLKEHYCKTFVKISASRQQ